MKRAMIMATLVLVGCVTQGVVYDLPHPNADVRPVPVRLVPYDPARIDLYNQNKHPNSVKTGAHWTAVFSNSDKIDETFTITHARLEDNWPEADYRATYFVKGELTCNGEVFPINAQGSRTAQLRFEKGQGRCGTASDWLDDRLNQYPPSAV